MFLKYTKDLGIGEKKTTQIQKILTGNGLQFQDLVQVRDELSRYQSFMRDELNQTQKLRQDFIKKTYNKPLPTEEEKLQIKKNKQKKQGKLFEALEKERLLAEDFIH